MSSFPFDPSEAVTFDLAFGHVHLDGAPTRVMVPAESLVRLCAAAGAAAATVMGQAIGEAMGRRVAVRLSRGDKNRHQAVRETGFSTIVEHLAGEVALCGLGALSAERWGKALVFVVDQSPFGADGDELLIAVLEAAVQSLTGQETRVVKLDRDGVRVRYLLASDRSADAVRARLLRGDGWTNVLALLHGGT